MIVGLSNTSLSGIPLPFELSIIGFPGCNLLCSAEVISAALSPSGVASFSPFGPSGIPNQPNLANIPLYAQALIPDPAAPNAAVP